MAWVNHLFLFSFLLHFILIESRQLPLSSSHHPLSSSPPNIVLIVADDLGYGDIKGFNEKHGAIDTPNVDMMLKNGMKFTDAHSTSSVCSPSRYSILTGRYNWRTRLQQGVLHGLSDSLITADRKTIGTILKEAGYTTACVGKWHVGMTMKGNQDDLLVPNDNVWKSIDFKTKITGGPTSVGFDYYYGISASLDMPPYMFIENEEFEYSSLSPEKVNWGRQGPTENKFKAVEVLPQLVTRSQKFLQDHLTGEHPQPVFLYLSLTSPHTPVLPSAEFLDKSRLGWYGDFVMQTDAAVGAIMSTLSSLHALHNTLVIFTSDNGFTGAGYMNGPRVDFTIHQPAGGFRGGKADIYEGGHRIPLVMQWPAVIQPGSIVSNTVSLADLFSTFADITSIPLSPTDGEDSYSLLPLLVGKDHLYARNHTVVHSFYGKFAIRQGKWLLAFCPGSGGWSPPRDEAVPYDSPRTQLFDLDADPGQTRNLLKQKGFDTLSARLSAVLKQIKESQSQRMIETDHSFSTLSWSHHKKDHNTTTTSHPHVWHNHSKLPLKKGHDHVIERRFR